MTIWTHTIVKNEERYIWFSVMSVIDYVDRVLIWDTGSTDKTLNIIKEIKKFYPDKVVIKEWGDVDSDKFTVLSQKMLEETDSDWFLNLDGDEVWWDDAIKELVGIIHQQGGVLESIVSRFTNIVGDIYHYQDESAGHYRIDGSTGHLTIRAMNRKIEGIHYAKPHGQRSVLDSEGTQIQDRDRKRRLHLPKPAFLHFTNVARSSDRQSELKVPKRVMKLKYELGNSFPRDYYYPEVFFKKSPNIVSSPWVRTTAGFKLRSILYSPLRLVKRSFISPGSGY